MATYATRTDNLNRLFADIRTSKVMTNEEEATAFTRYANGDSSVVEEIVRANMRFVVARAKAYSKSDDRLEDFIQEGAIGLYTAIPRFDISKGYKFFTFAKYYIDLFIRRYIFELSPVRQSNDKKIAPRVKQIRDRYFQLNEREATEWEIADILETEFGIVVKDMRDITALSFTRLDKEVGEEDCTALDCGEIATRTAYTNEVETEIDHEDNAHTCKVLMARLTEKERKIITLAFGIGMDEPMLEEDIAEMMGYTAERIRQIKKEAIAKMQR